MSMNNINAEIKKFQEEMGNVARHTKQNIKDALAKTVKLFERTMKSKVPKGQSWRAGKTGAKKTLTGTLSKSIIGDIYNDGYSGFVGTNINYAACVEYGTKAHIIRPKNKRALRYVTGWGLKGSAFTKTGKVRKRREAYLIYSFARFVNHPGTKAQPFVEPTLNEKREEVLRYFNNGLEASLE